MPAHARVAWRALLEGDDDLPSRAAPSSEPGETPVVAPPVKRRSRWDPETWGTTPEAQAELAHATVQARVQQ